MEIHLIYKLFVIFSPMRIEFNNHIESIDLLFL